MDSDELSDSVPLETLSEKCTGVDGEVCVNGDLSHDSTSSQMRSDWSVRDTWTCPPFSYEQSTDHVTIVLHVPCVKKATVTSVLEKNSVREIGDGDCGRIRLISTSYTLVQPRLSKLAEDQARMFRKSGLLIDNVCMYQGEEALG